MSFQPAIMSVSLGRGWLHNFEEKMAQAAKVGFRGIEIFFEDLEYLARKFSGNSEDYPSRDSIFSAARHARAACDANGLDIITLQPFLFYDGLKDREQHAKLLEKLKDWFQLVKILGTTTIQVPANFLPADQLVDDPEMIAADLRELADLGLAETPPIRFAYENLCWSTHINTWQAVWDVVTRVDRPNFGMCLDTFNIAGRVWSDPASPTGKTPNADEDMRKSIEELVKTVDVKKVFYLQVVDGERMDSPVVRGHPFHVDGQPPRMNWSRNARCFMYEENRGAHMPCEDIAKAIIFGLGYKGYVSLELFSRTMAEDNPNVPADHAQRGIKSWNTFVERLKLN
ncbi:putative 4-hydroxyphenylpyruvate dioxygenase [Dactylonectria macrodidyma]|uniref:4-hydroxyphenylpyruvate dioxygenase n=1 Tax=Dactylonectria macrodidyma TaxID=307937 RepID=A0A9P9IUB1_9HYPO|nr:putative 4-hydroxyphenylpyruvate dioxygenase [Dactylonectria macrodidyma]